MRLSHSLSSTVASDHRAARSFSGLTWVESDGTPAPGAALGSTWLSITIIGATWAHVWHDTQADDLDGLTGVQLQAICDGLPDSLSEPQADAIITAAELAPALLTLTAKRTAIAAWLALQVTDTARRAALLTVLTTL